MEYKYETHCHTSEASLCGESSAKDMVEAYYKAGYAGIVITDHFFNGNTAIPTSLPWIEWVNRFCLGYENALEAAKRFDLDIFFGFEYSYHGTEFLIYGLGKDYLLANPEIKKWNLDTFFEKISKAGGFINHAHPFREAEYINEIRLYPDKVDAVEATNSRNTEIFNKKAHIYAENYNLPKLSGSDTHNADVLNGGGIYFGERLYTGERFVNMLKCKKYSIYDK